MDLKQLQYLVTCAQAGSFSDAAKTLYSTQSSVSKVIKALEDNLGMQLFERLPRGIRLTGPCAPQSIHVRPECPQGRRWGCLYQWLRS